MTGYAFHPEARFDLDEIWEYIRASVPFPKVGHKRPDLTSRPLRFISVRQYIIAYAPDEKPLWAVAVIHGQRSRRVMAAILKGGEMGSADRVFRVTCR